MSTSSGQQPKVRNKYALASAIFGITGLAVEGWSQGGANMLMVVVGLIAGLAAIGTGVLGYRAAQELEKQKGRFWAIAGIAIGAIVLIVSIVLFF